MLHLTTDSIRSIASFFSPLHALSLICTCKHTMHALDTSEYWEMRALHWLRRLQTRLTKTCLVPIDWKRLLRMDDITRLQLKRVCVQASFGVLSPKAYPDMTSMIMFLLDHSKSIETCEHKLVELIRLWPHAYLYSDWVPLKMSGSPAWCQIGFTLTKGLCNVVILGQDLPCPFPSKLSVDMVVVNGTRYDHRHCSAPRFDVLYNEHAFGASTKTMGAPNISLALCMHTIRRRMEELSPLPENLSLAPTHPLAASFAISAVRTTCFALYALRAIELDDLAAMRGVLEAYSTYSAASYSPSHIHDEPVSTICGPLMWLSIDESLIPQKPWFILPSPSDVTSLVAYELKLSQDAFTFVHDVCYVCSAAHVSSAPPPSRPPSYTPLHPPFTVQHNYFDFETNASNRRTSLNLFMLFGSKLCPKIYRWWIQHCPTYNDFGVVKLRETLHHLDLPSIERVPVGTPRRFVRVDR